MMRAASVVLSLAIAASSVFHVDAHAQKTKSLPVAFQDLVSRYNPEAVGYEENALRVAGLVPGANPEEISSTLPEIQAAIAQQDGTIKKFGAYVLAIISYRPDSADLLGGHVHEITGLLSERDPHLQEEAVLILGGMKPVSPRTVVSPLMEFVREIDRDPIAQVNAISALLRLAPADVAPGLKRFASRIADSQTKEALANGIANSKTDDSEATDVLINMLTDSDEQVRFQAAQAFQRLPSEDVRRAQRALQRIKEQPDEAQEVRDAAKSALKTLDHQD